MATASTNNKTATDPSAMAEKAREQLLATVQQSQKMSVDAAQTWVKAVSVLPVMEMPEIPGMFAMPTLEAATKFTFDVASDLLEAQRDYALKMASLFTPEKSV